MSNICKFSELPKKFKLLLNEFKNELVNSGHNRKEIVDLVKKIYNLYYNIENCGTTYLMLDNVIQSIIYIILDHLYGENSIKFDNKFKVYYDKQELYCNLSLYKLIPKITKCLCITDIYNNFEKMIIKYSYNPDNYMTDYCILMLDTEKYNKNKG